MFLFSRATVLLNWQCHGKSKKAGGDGMKLGFIQKHVFLATKDIYNISNDGKCGQDKCLKFWQLSLGMKFINLI